jgi:hypothetical protein
MPSSLGTHRNSPAHRRRPDKTAHRLRDDRVTAGLAAPTHELDPGRIPMSKQKRRGGCGGAVGQPDALHRTLTNLEVSEPPPGSENSCTYAFRLDFFTIGQCGGSAGTISSRRCRSTSGPVDQADGREGPSGVAHIAGQLGIPPLRSTPMAVPAGVGDSSPGFSPPPRNEGLGSRRGDEQGCIVVPDHAGGPGSDGGTNPEVPIAQRTGRGGLSTAPAAHRFLPGSPPLPAIDA